MDIRERSELQLLRISRGALELTHMIDSWCKTSTLGFKSTEMANELLRGSLELQESLEMLSMLQMASRRMCKKRIRQRGREEDDEESFFMAMSSKSYGRLSVDSSTNSVEELKQVIRDRLCSKDLLSLKSDNEKASSNSGLKLTNRKINFCSQTEKIKAPSLIAKLMGLEQFPSGSNYQKIEQEKEEKEHSEQKSLKKIIETMKFKGFQKNDHSERQRVQNFDQDDKILPIVILKSVNLPSRDEKEMNSASETISEREKTTLAELLLEEKTSDLVYTPVKRNLKYNTEKIQNLRIGVDPSKKQQEKEFNTETKTTVDGKNSVFQGKKFAELKDAIAIRAPANTTSVESTNSENGKLAAKSKCGENKSREKPVKKFIEETKTDDQKFEDGKLIISGTETRAVSRSNSMVIRYDLLKQRNKETIIFVHKDAIKKDHKIVCEVMPRTNQAQNSRPVEQSTKIFSNESTTNPAAKSQLLFKNQFLNSKSFHDYVHSFFRINTQTKNTEDLKVGDEQLLLDCTKELMARKSHEENISISEMLRQHQRKRSSFPSSNKLLEEISNGIEGFTSYSENGKVAVTKNSHYTILEKDLNATWDVQRNNLVCFEEADQVAAEVEKQIISRLIMEVAMDLVALE